MAIAFVAASAVVTGSNPTVAVPAGYAQGNLLIIVATTPGGLLSSVPTGWVSRYVQTGGQRINILTKYATTQETSVSLAGLNDAGCKAVMLCYSGAGSYDVVGTLATGSSATATTTAQTTTYANDYVISIYARAIGASTFTTPASTTSRVNSSSTATINGLNIVDELQASAGLGTARASTLSVAGAWSAINLSFVPTRTLYWVGGTGTWSATNTGNWANTSGGSGVGILPPAPTETATFDASSGTGTVTLTGTTDATTAACGILASASNSLTFAGTGNLLMSFAGSGSLTLASTNVWSNTGLITMNGLTTSVSTSTVSMASSITYNATGGTLTLSTNLTLGTAATFTLTRGTLSLSTFTLSCGLFSSNNANTRVIAFGTGNITTTGSGTVFDTANANGLSYTGTPTVNISNNSATATTVTSGTSNSGPANSFDFNFTTGTYTLTLTTLSNVRSLNFTGFTGTWSPGTASYVFYGSLILVSGMTFTTGSGTFTFASSSNTQVITSAGKGLPTIVQNGAGGTVQLAAGTSTMSSTATYTLTAGTLDLGTNTATLSCGLFSSTNSNTRSIIFGTGAITTTGSGSVWDTTTATGLSYTGTPTVNISNNSATATTVTAGTTGGAATNALNFNFTTGTYALTLTSASVVNSLNFTGFTGSWSPGLSHNLTFYGSLTFVSGMTFSNGNGTWSFNAASGTQTITSAGKTLGNIAQAGAANTVQLVGTTALSTNLTYTLTSGTLDLNNNTLSANTFSSSNTNTRSILFGTGNITVVGTATPWDTGTATNLTYTGTPTVNVTSATTATVTAGTTGGASTNAFNFVRSTGTALTLTTGSVIRNLDFTGFTGTWAPSTATCTYYGNLTLVSGMTFTTGTGLWTFAATSGTQVITSASKTLYTITQNGAGGTVQFAAGTTTLSSTYTLTAGTLDVGTNTATLSCSTFDSSSSNTRSIVFGTGQITLTGSNATIWNTATATSFTYSGTAKIVSNYVAFGTRTFSFGSITVPFTVGSGSGNQFSFGTASNDTVSFLGSVNALDFTGYLGTWAQSTNAMSITSGNLTLGSGMTCTSSVGVISFTATSGTQTITCAGKTINAVTKNGTGGTLSLVDAFRSNSLTVTLGTFNANNQNVTTTLGGVSIASSASNTVTMGSGTWSLGGTGTVWSKGALATLNVDTSTILLSANSTVSRTFAGGGATYNNLTIGGGSSGATVITGSNTFNTLASTKATAYTLTLPASGTTTVADWTISGTSGNVVTLNSSSAGTQSTLTKTGGGVISGIDYLSIQDSNATPATTWYAGANSTNVSNNTGWIFSGYVPSNGNFFFMFN